MIRGTRLLIAYLLSAIGGFLVIMFPIELILFSVESMIIDDHGVIYSIFLGAAYSALTTAMGVALFFIAIFINP